MPAAPITEVLDKLAGRARNDLSTYRINQWQLRPVWGAVIGSIVGGASLPDPRWGMAAGLLIGVACGLVISVMFAGQATSWLARWRGLVREQLLEQGLLLLILEHDPYGRLPSLRPRQAVAGAAQPGGEAGSFRERLELAVAHYRGCCKDAGLRLPAWPAAGSLLPIAVRLELAELLRTGGEDNSAPGVTIARSANRH